jgi:hypothetical protein
MNATTKVPLGGKREEKQRNERVTHEFGGY